MDRKLLSCIKYPGDGDVIIPQRQHITITDDLLEQPKITFAVGENAYLRYELRLDAGNAQSLTKNLAFVCNAPGAHVEVVIRAETLFDEKVNIKTMQHHRAPYTTSSLVLRGVHHDCSMLRSENLIRIDKGLMHISAQEQHKSLLVGNRARVVSIPQLEVLSHEVSCRHGSAISRISDEDLFYLQTRGLSYKNARDILIKAFLNGA